MKVEILEFVEGAQRARGVTVIIDVFRAFSVACYAYDCGAVRILTASDPAEAFLLKNKYRNSLLVGERDEKKIEGFDLGNSPTEILKTNLTGKTVIHSTTAGTRGLNSAVNADVLITGSLVNSAAVVRYIKTINPEIVSLVAMGYRATQSAQEDLLCAEIISSGLSGETRDFETEISDLKNSSGKRFFDINNLDFSPPTDFFLCTMLNRFDFVLRAEKMDDSTIGLRRIDI